MQTHDCLYDPEKAPIAPCKLDASGQARDRDADLGDVILPSTVVGHCLPTAVQIYSGCWAFDLGFGRGEDIGVNVHQSGAKSGQQAVSSFQFANTSHGSATRYSTYYHQW